MRIPVVPIAIAIGIVLTAVIVWRIASRRSAVAHPSEKRIAVLPFENLGNASDAYFADGVADEVRGKLSSIPGFVVIARESSEQYKHTTKSARDITGVSPRRPHSVAEDECDQPHSVVTGADRDPAIGRSGHALAIDVRRQRR